MPRITGRKRLIAIRAAVTAVGVLAIFPIASNLTSNWLVDLLNQRTWLAPMLWVGLFAFIVAWLWLRRGARQAQLHNEFALIVPSEKLRPEHLQFEEVAARVEPADPTRRPYVEGVYVPRVAIRDSEQADGRARNYTEAELRSFLEEGRSILLIGKPTEGKTRTLFEITRTLKGYLVVQPQDPLPSPAAMELLRGQKVLCLFDDINTAVEKRIDLLAFYQQVQQLAGDRALAAACRDGSELAALKLRLTTSPVQKLYECFSDRFVLRPASDEEEASLARQLGRQDDQAYLSLGDVSMRGAFELMQQRFERLEELDRECLWAMQLLAEGGVQQLERRRVLALLQHQYGQALQPAQLREPLNRLRRNGFLVGAPDDDPIVPEAAFVTGARAQRNYRDGFAPARDLPQLIGALRSLGDPVGLNSIALNQYNSGQAAVAIELWWGTFQAFASATSVEARGGALAAGANAGIALDMQDRHGEALQLYDEVVRRFEHDSSPRVREQVAKVLSNSGVTLGKLGLPEKELQRYDEVVHRFEDDSAPGVHEPVANALFNSGVTLDELGRLEEALQRYDEVVHRFEHDSSPSVREQVAAALFNSVVTLGKLGHLEKALQRCAEVVRRFEGDRAPGVREQVAKALSYSIVMLAKLGRPEEALQRCAEVVRRFEGDTAPVILQALQAARGTLEEADR
jgi:tetratricopeptide (TPR) repeat protein